MNIHYDSYEVILSGKSDIGVCDPKLTFIYSDKKDYLERLKVIVKKRVIHGDIVVLSNLDSFPDERFLMITGRILSIPGVGAVGGFVDLRNNHTTFEFISHSVIRSFFLNYNLMYRFKPMNYKEVKELQLSGFFIRREFIEKIDFRNTENLKLEYVLSKQVHKLQLKLVYSPDIMLYKKFPDNPKYLMEYIRREAYFRAAQIRSKAYDSLKGIFEIKFAISIIFLLFIIFSILLTFLFRSIILIFPAIGYYLLLGISRCYFLGFKNGIISFFYLSLAQIAYSIYYLIGILKNKKTQPTN